MIRDRRTILGLLGVAILSVATVPFLLSADDPEMAVRRRQIAGMSEAERERIQRNFQQFESMSTEQRRQLRAFDAALEADRTAGHGRFSDTLNVYADWLRMITPHQRDELQQESDPGRRIARIREIVQSQRDERIESRMEGRAEQRFGRIPNLSRDDLHAMLAVLDRRASTLLSQADRDVLADYSGVRRSLKIFELLARDNRNIRDLLSETSARTLLESVTDPETREQLETIPEGERPWPPELARRLKLGMAIQKAVFAELDKEHRRRTPSQENLEDFFEGLARDEQDELLSLSPEEFQQELRGRYIESEWSESPVLTSYIRYFFRTQGPGDRPPPGGPRRGGREREGRPGPPDRRPFDRP